MSQHAFTPPWHTAPRLKPLDPGAVTCPACHPARLSLETVGHDAWPEPAVGHQGAQPSASKPTALHPSWGYLCAPCQASWTGKQGQVLYGQQGRGHLGCYGCQATLVSPPGQLITDSGPTPQAATDGSRSFWTPGMTNSGSKPAMPCCHQVCPPQDL